MGQTRRKLAAVPARTRGEATPASIRVLLIEDEPTSAELTSFYLQSGAPTAGVTVVPTLEDALACLQRAPFDLAILDLNLPDSSGLDTVRSFAQSCKAPFIVVTGEEETAMREQVIAAGAFEFLQKQQLNRESLQRLVRLASLYARNLHSLRESEARYRMLADLSSDMHWEQDAEYRFISFTGKSPSVRNAQVAMIGKRRWDGRYLNLTDADWAAHRALLEARQPFYDLQLCRLDQAGQEVWISTSGQPLFADDGTFKGYRGVGRDITAAKRAARALLESEERFRRLTALSSDWYWEQDSDFRLTFMSTSLEERTGLAAQPFLGRHRWEQPALNLTAEDWARHRAQLERHEPFHDFEMQRPTADGGSRWLAISGEPFFDKAGRFLGYRGIGRDITERKREERLLRLEQSVAHYLSGAEVKEDEAVRFVLRSLCEPQGWKCARLFRVDAHAGVMRFEAGWNAPERPLEEFMAASRKLEVRPGAGLVGSVWRTMKAQWVPDAQADERMSQLPLWRAAGLRSALAFPLISRATTIGVVSISSPRIREPDERLLHHLQIVGSQVGQFLERRRAEQLRRLEHAVNRALAQAGTSAEVLKEAMRAICETHDWDTARYFEIDAAGGVMRFRESWAKADGAAKRYVQAFEGAIYRPDEGLVGVTWRSGEPLWVPDVGADPRVAHPDIALETGMRCALAIPVAFEGAINGVMSFTSRELREPDQQLLQTLVVAARQIGQYLLRKRSEDAGRRFRLALDSAGDMVLLVDAANGTLLDFNSTACRHLGYERQELLNRRVETIVQASIDELRTSVAALTSTPERSDSQRRTYRRKDGSTFPAEVLRRMVDSPEGAIVVINARDLTEREAADRRQSAHLRYQEKIARLGQSALGVRRPDDLILDAAQAVLEGLAADAVAYVEQGSKDGTLIVREVLGLPEEPANAVAECAAADTIVEVLKTGAPALIEQATRPPLPFNWAASAASAALVPVAGERTTRGALCALCRQPSALATDEMRFIEAAASVLSTGLQRIDSEGRLAYLAQFDALTALPNRALLADRFAQMIVQARRHAKQLGVLFIDLDDFKLVNDALGHAAGDQLLRQVAARLERSVRPGDTVARISGDEFAAVLADLARPDDAAIVAQKILDTLAAPVDIGGKEVFAAASIGIATFPSDGDDAEALLRAADAAMYRAKESHRNSYQFFTAEINERSRERTRLRADLRRALEREEFSLLYQPQIDLRTGSACGAEALLRWRHPDGSLIPPLQFIPVLEETGLIIPVGEWVIRRACEDLKNWGAAGHARAAVAINISARQFRLPDLDVRIKAVIEAACVDPSLIELEITESQLMVDPEHSIRMLCNLRAAGMSIVLDDFGTGYSSLAYLTRFPLAALKIDRSFVKDVLCDQADATIVRTIVDMAKQLGLRVVGEGVETADQAAFLRQLGCEAAQGYLFAQPMPAPKLLDFFSKEIRQ